MTDSHELRLLKDIHLDIMLCGDGTPLTLRERDWVERIDALLSRREGETNSGGTPSVLRGQIEAHSATNLPPVQKSAGQVSNTDKVGDGARQEGNPPQPASVALGTGARVPNAVKVGDGREQAAATAAPPATTPAAPLAPTPGIYIDLLYADARYLLPGEAGQGNNIHGWYENAVYWRNEARRLERERDSAIERERLANMRADQAEEAAASTSTADKGKT